MALFAALAINGRAFSKTCAGMAHYLKRERTMPLSWTSGNKFTLLENGDAYFPRVFAALNAAKREVLVETFILFEDKVGNALHAALLDAARRGVRVELTFDGFGSPDLSKGFVDTLVEAGVRVHIFDPAPRLFRKVNYFRRMHRKLVVVDGARAFVGGINFSADHLLDFGPEAKQDYAVEAEGPIVAHIHRFLLDVILDREAKGRRSVRPVSSRPKETELKAGGADSIFTWRDNIRHKNDIERQYRLAIRLARKRVVIANAYFFPGYRFLRELRNAARRGVEVSLILQGKPDMQIVQTAAAMLYHYLLQGGVRIYEYSQRPFHGKVALIDDEWATIGSSNLDPISLSLNLEANLMIRSRAFNQTLYEHMQKLKTNSKKIEARDLQESTLWRKIRSVFVFHILRHYPAWAGFLPAHMPRLKSLPEVTELEGKRQVDKAA